MVSEVLEFNRKKEKKKKKKKMMKNGHFIVHPPTHCRHFLTWHSFWLYVANSDVISLITELYTRYFKIDPYFDKILGNV